MWKLGIYTDYSNYSWKITYYVDKESVVHIIPLTNKKTFCYAGSTKMLDIEEHPIFTYSFCFDILKKIKPIIEITTLKLI